MSLTFSLSAMALFDSLYSPDDVVVCVAPEIDRYDN